MSELFVFEMDINLDGESELFFVRGYDSAADVYDTVFTHFKLYLSTSNREILFQDWLLNLDFEYIPPDTVGTPRITALGGGTPYGYLVKYAETDDLANPEGLGLKRINSLFFFDFLDESKDGVSKQLVLVWSQIYRPSADPTKRDFLLDEERFRWFEGDVTNNTSFVEKVITEEAFRSFIDGHGLAFEDGLTAERLCAQ